eukprot:Gb_19619 [translate_table: standard]
MTRISRHWSHRQHYRQSSTDSDDEGTTRYGLELLPDIPEVSSKGYWVLVVEQMLMNSLPRHQNDGGITMWSFTKMMEVIIPDDDYVWVHDYHLMVLPTTMLGLDYESKRGYTGLEYYGHTVGIKILSVGIHKGRLESVLSLADTMWRVGELRKQYNGKIMLLGVDEMDIFKGISLKLLAMEQILKKHPKWRGKEVLVQIANPARGRGKDV